MPTEPLYRLDLVIDTKKPLWSTIQEMAALYRSSIIYSNGKFKIISERDDLPVRQVFHSGNIVRERTEIRIGKDPMQINQITGQFSNRDLDWERDVLIVQDSQSVLIDNDPIKPYELDLTGIARKSEIGRRLSVEMRRRNVVAREVTFTTGLEGIVVEPGDRCVAGILMTDYEEGYGGRALDGSTTSLLADRIVTLAESKLYDLWVWHTAADTPEVRTLTGTCGLANLIPSTPFNFAVQENDRWAIGVQSEQLIHLLAKKVVHNADGLTQITGDEFTQVGYLLDCPDSLVNGIDYYQSPSHPWSITSVVSDCIACFQLHFTAPTCIGGTLLQSVPDTPYINNSFLIVFPTTTNIPTIVSSYDQGGFIESNTMTFISGPNSGLSRRILSYPSYRTSETFSGQWNMFVSPLPNRSHSGDQYYITIDQGSNFAGFQPAWYTNTGGAVGVSSQTTLNAVQGNSYCFDLSNTADSLFLELNFIAPTGAITYRGPVFLLNIPGCFDQSNHLGAVNSITTQSLSNFFALNLPGSQMSMDEYFQLKAIGYLNDVCASGETTKASFGLSYAGSTVVDSLLITLRDANSPALSVGSNSLFELTATLRAYSTPQTNVRATFKYDGFQVDGTRVSTELFTIGMNSVNFTRTQTLAFTVLVSHTDTTGAVHSHGCHAITLDHGEFQSIDTTEQ